MFRIIQKLSSTTFSVALAMGLPACSSSYVPARSPHLAVTQHAGGFTYIRDGQRFSGGLIGGGLEDAVRGVPRAEDAARSYARETGWGLGTALGGAGLMLTGLAIFPRLEPTVWNTRAYTGLSLVGLGLAVYTTGLILVVNAAPRQWDAINIYNDEVDARLRAQFSAQMPNSAGYGVAPFSTTTAPALTPAPVRSMSLPMSTAQPPSIETPSKTGNPAVGRFPAPQDVADSPAPKAPASGK